MTSSEPLLIITAALETITGVALLVAPTVPVSVLLGASLDAPGGLVMARVAGAALLSLGVACWRARGDGQSRAGRAVVAAMLLYNVAAVSVLTQARFGLGLTGAGLWAAVGLHAGLAVWCVAWLRAIGGERKPRITNQTS